MDQDLKSALLRNLEIKTKIVIGLFIGIFLLQTLGLLYIYSAFPWVEVPALEAFAVPAFILIVVVDEFFILKYVRLAKNGERKFPVHWSYIIVILEILYPTIVLYYGSHLFAAYFPGITPFMFTNSPPLFIYVLLIILSTFHFNFKLSLLGGLLAGLGFLFITLFVADGNYDYQFIVNLSKVPFLIVAGLVAGFVGRRLMKSVEDSLKAKNTLIYKLDEKVKERTVQIEEQKEQLAVQNENLEEKNKEITDSINYAQRIQDAYLPPANVLSHFFPQSFLFFQPKDIVSGDFYWFYSPHGDHSGSSDEVFVAAADCTGHGVPGAIMSVICCNALNDIIVTRGIMEPGRILDEVRNQVVTMLKSEQRSERKDGMDIALMRINRKTKEVTFAGANNPLWIITNNEEQLSKVTKESADLKYSKEDGKFKLFELKADKQPVGSFHAQKPFTTGKLKVSEGDTLYVFSDGFADQFGGNKGKKFKAANFKKLLLSMQQKDMDQQKMLVKGAFDNWKGELEQLDDVCIIGVRI